MSILIHIRNKLRGIAQSRGTRGMKRMLWNSEFAAGNWNHIADTRGDFIYDLIGRHIGGGAILDLACGVGATGVELPAGSYRSYVGVDISDVALDEARAKATAIGRSATNIYIQSDMETYRPSQRADVILLRECLYYVPKPRIPAMLNRLAAHLEPRGVIIVRLFDGRADYVSVVKDTLQIIEQVNAPDSPAVALVCR
jgi:2-polyprenyl-3-methyl-5-hydroxy-6-metoxy-1,4-benzoquinol methylase